MQCTIILVERNFTMLQIHTWMLNNFKPLIGMINPVRHSLNAIFMISWIIQSQHMINHIIHQQDCQ